MAQDNHAISNGQGWLQTITEAMEALEELESGEAESVTFDSAEYDDADELRDRLQEMPLSVQVRSDWHYPSATDDSARPAQFNILLTTGGPALRIIGKLSEYGGPETVNLEWQDWGTPWTRIALSQEQEKHVLSFAGQFYYGEG